MFLLDFYFYCSYTCGMEEIWKDIEGYEGLYQVSNLGRVKSLSRLIIRSTGRNYYIPERLLNAMLDKDGYERVCLTNAGKGVNRFIHRLVALAFIRNPENKLQINHKNGVKTDNRVENLEWNTNSENIKHSYNFLNRPRLRGESNGGSKLTKEAIEEIRNSTLSQGKLSKIYNVSQQQISRIVNYENWKYA